MLLQSGIVLLVCLLIVANSTLTTDSLDIESKPLYYGKKTPIEPTRCQVYVVKANYRKIQVLINGNGIDYAFATDAQLEGCMMQNFKDCPENNTFCLRNQIPSNPQLRIDTHNMQGVTRMTVNKCTNKFYVYLYIRDYQPSDISIRAINDGGCDSIAENDYTKCASIPIDKCGLDSPTMTESQIKDCDSNCFRLDCTYLDAFDKNRTSLSTCLPSFLQKERFEEFCNNENNYFKTLTKAAVPHYCGGKNVRRIPRSIQQVKSLSVCVVFETIVYMLMLMGALFVILVFWYRMSFARTGVPPFNPPNWIPAFILPRQAPPRSSLREMSDYRTF